MAARLRGGARGRRCGRRGVAALPSASPAAPPATAAGAAVEDARLASLERHGAQCMAWSTLDGGLRSLEVGLKGYQAYVSDGRRTLCFFDPVCDPRDVRAVVARAAQALPDPAFVHVGEDVAAVLSEVGFSVAPYGWETRLELPLQLAGTRGRPLRAEHIRGARLGYTLQEVVGSDELAELAYAEMQRVSDEWLASRGGRPEVGVVTRRLVCGPERHVRKFVLRDGGGNACGVLVLDPQMRNGAVEGYGTSVSRFGDGAFNGAFGFCVVEASRQLALTGSSARTLDIGLAPFAPGPHDPLRPGWRSAPAVERMLTLLYETIEPLYNVRGLDGQKRKFRRLCGATVYPQYVGVRSALPLGHVLLGLQVGGIVPGKGGDRR